METLRALERSYSENELKIRSLLNELASQRDALNANAERVRGSNKPRTSLPKPGKVEGLRAFWKEKATQK